MIGIFGGTFDPIHYGHLRTALEVLEQVGLEAMFMVPCRIPPHRGSPMASPEARRDMVALALPGQDRLRLDERELGRAGPSYMVDTLDSFREEYGNTPLGLVLGQDAFAALDAWHDWTRLPELAHLLVMTRPGEGIPERGRMAELLAEHTVSDPADLKNRPAGRIFLCQVTPLAISATAIREQQAAGRSSRYLTPDAVLDYMVEHQLYS